MDTVYPELKMEDLSERERITVERVRSSMLGMAGARYEVKEIKMSRIHRNAVSLVLEVGLQNDGESAASIFCRSRCHVMIGRRGGVRILRLSSGLKDVQAKYRHLYVGRFR